MKCATPGKYKRKTLIERKVNMKEYIQLWLDDKINHIKELAEQ